MIHARTVDKQSDAHVLICKICRKVINANKIAWRLVIVTIDRRNVDLSSTVEEGRRAPRISSFNFMNISIHVEYVHVRRPARIHDY